MQLLLWAVLAGVQAGPTYWHVVTRPSSYDAALGELRATVGAEAGRWSFFGILDVAGGQHDSLVDGAIQIGAGGRVRLGSRVRLGLDLTCGTAVSEYNDGGPVQDYWDVGQLDGAVELDLVSGPSGALYLGATVGYLFTFGQNIVEPAILERQMLSLHLGLGYRY